MMGGSTFTTNCPECGEKCTAYEEYGYTTEDCYWCGYTMWTEQKADARTQKELIEYWWDNNYLANEFYKDQNKYEIEEKDIDKYLEWAKAKILLKRMESKKK